LNQAVRNVNDGISTVQIVEGALSEVTSILQRMRDLAVQASSDGITSTERGYLDTEQAKLASALDSAIDGAKFGNKDLVGSSGTTVTIQSGSETSDRTDIVIDSLSSGGLSVHGNQLSLQGSEVISVQGVVASADGDSSDEWVWTDGVSSVTATGDFTSISAIAAGLDAAADTASVAIGFSAANGEVVATHDTYTNQGPLVGAVSLQYTAGNGGSATNSTGATILQQGASFGLSTIDTALDTVAEDRATLGAMQAQLESMVRNLANVAENTAAAAGRVVDTDYATETANLTKAQILQQAATSILAQANAQPQAVLSLLQ
jgi:flagellin